MTLWLSEKRFYKLTVADPNETPEARIHEDTRIAIEYAVDLAGGIILSAIVGLGFIYVLWTTAGSITVAGVTVPGYMVLVSLGYSLVLSFLTWLTARLLVVSVEKNAQAEAQFRYELTRVRENAETVALIGGEEDERQRLSHRLGDVVRSWWGVIRDRARVNSINQANNILAPVVPVVLVAPKYLAGK